MTAWRCTESRTRGLHPTHPWRCPASRKTKLPPSPSLHPSPPGRKCIRAAAGWWRRMTVTLFFSLLHPSSVFPKRDNFPNFPRFFIIRREKHARRRMTRRGDLPGILRSNRHRARGEKIAKYFAEYEGSLHGNHSKLKDISFYKKLL